MNRRSTSTSSSAGWNKALERTLRKKGKENPIGKYTMVAPDELGTAAEPLLSASRATSAAEELVLLDKLDRGGSDKFTLVDEPF